MESIEIIVFPFFTAAFVFFLDAVLEHADFALDFFLAFAFPKSKAMSARPLTDISIFPSALVNRGAMPPIKPVTMPNTTTVFAKLARTSILPQVPILPVRPASSCVPNSMFDEVFPGYNRHGSRQLNLWDDFINKALKNLCLARFRNDDHSYVLQGE